MKKTSHLPNVPFAPEQNWKPVAVLFLVCWIGICLRLDFTVNAQLTDLAMCCWHDELRAIGSVSYFDHPYRLYDLSRNPLHGTKYPQSAWFSACETSR